MVVRSNIPLWLIFAEKKKGNYLFNKKIISMEGWDDYQFNTIFISNYKEIMVSRLLDRSFDKSCIVRFFESKNTQEDKNEKF